VKEKNKKPKNNKTQKPKKIETLVNDENDDNVTDEIYVRFLHTEGEENQKDKLY